MKDIKRNFELTEANMNVTLLRDQRLEGITESQGLINLGETKQHNSLEVTNRANLYDVIDTFLGQK